MKAPTVRRLGFGREWLGGKSIAPAVSDFFSNSRPGASV